MTNLMTDISRCIFLDVETLPTDRPDVIAYLDDRIEIPGTMSKPETIEAWRVDKRPGVLAEAIAKTSFEGGLGRVASVAFAVGDDQVVSATSAKPASGDAPAGYDVAQEVKLLTRLWDALERVHRETGRVPTVVGHNVASFDIRWLWKRSVVLGISAPSWWPLDAKPWERDRVYDTMLAWEGHGGRISQDRLALCLGLPRKDGFDGSQVAEAWERGEFERIRTYNAGDVETVRAIWKRLNGWKPAVVETAAERDAAIDEAVRVSQNGGATAMPAFETEIVDVGHQTLDRPIRTGVGFRPGAGPAVKAEGSAHSTTGAAA